MWSPAWSSRQVRPFLALVERFVLIWTAGQEKPVRGIDESLPPLAGDAGAFVR